MVLVALLLLCLEAVRAFSNTSFDTACNNVIDACRIALTEASIHWCWGPRHWLYFASEWPWGSSEFKLSVNVL